VGAPDAPRALAQGAVTTPIEYPTPGGAGGFADAPPAGMAPTKTPAQAGPGFAGQALPTNQWWSSALTGPLTQPMWAHPLAVRATDNGVQVSSAAPTASANAVVTGFVPALTAGLGVTAVTVTGYGAFHVVLRAALRGGGSVDVTVVQGSPVLWLSFHGTAPVLTATGAVTVLGAAGSSTRLDIAGRRWDVVADGRPLTVNGNTLTGDKPARVAVARVPDGADPAAWERAVKGVADDPVLQTTATTAYAAGQVTQTLSARRRSGKPGVWALLPHQQGEPGGTALRGTYPNVRGTMTLVQATAIQVRVPMPGLLSGVPAIGLSTAARASVGAELDRDLADPPGAGGSYFGLKELGRLATVAEVAQAVGATGPARVALQRLKPQLVDWLTYAGPQDGRYFAYDSSWGGLIGVPAEFGSQDYNDHHFQYGYLVRAAAVLAAADAAFARDYAEAVDAVVRDFSGTLSAPGPAGFPAFRAFNAYLGSSAASGYAAFADGNNQESSSEAVAAWEAVTRWATVRGNARLASFGAAHYALEAATARMYWLGEGVTRQAGYAHTTAGIVWDAKIDFATWFDAKRESIIGIQLLPLTFGSLYRSNRAAAAARAKTVARPVAWGDLFAADLALADPDAARDRLVAGVAEREPSTSRAMVRYWVEALAVLGAPQPAVTVDGAHGLAFGPADAPTLVAVNSARTAHSVRVRRGGKVVATVPVPPGETVVRRL
ncbi:MAG TPA: glycosyl hydrolase, partial [Actinoplanes sp.]|nr:glycosyl hydrolase [Actinoplanes sp.]